MAETAKLTTAGQVQTTPPASPPSLLDQAKEILGNDGPWIYIGPTSPKLGVQKLKNYIELTQTVINALNEHPALRTMFITADQWHQVRPQVIGGYKGPIQHAGLHLAKQGVFADLPKVKR